MRIMISNVEINNQARLSQHFTLGELCKTSVKTADGNIPSHVHIENMKRQRHLLASLRRSSQGQQDEDEVDGEVRGME